jgi:hypothetical protein
VEWLVLSVFLSLALTVALHVLVRLFPGAAGRAASWFESKAAPRADERTEPGSRVRAIVPWRVMIVGSIILTIVVNLLLWAK